MFTDSEKRTSVTVKHLVANVSPRHKVDAIMHLIDSYSKDGRVLIFTNTKSDANFLSMDLVVDNHVLHSEFEQKQREKRLADFKNGDVKVLIATDVAARGIDIPSVELVIQVHPPQNTEAYIHRSGRTGRAGREGVCCTVVNSEQSEHRFSMNKIIKSTNTEVEQIKILPEHLEDAKIRAEEIKHLKR